VVCVFSALQLYLQDVRVQKISGEKKSFENVFWRLLQTNVGKVILKYTMPVYFHKKQNLN
jgi:hypothetical protein